ncbi:hypothetical protein GHK92_14575 [Nocardioides sp. dk4132]|uniref:hypothetical protein n=1 Tax=unclassified Nocardioides TaxID=2615069 RepID=UPI0012961939|nr:MULTISPECIES: hypothetical protein [unclassified Nocardioides]MQW77102.1 hypothetical protein [Nocardioides sp. dk4132]QGA05991.1 hypothetical protein GFH29_00195 [Nocardioides sp. dk884]
MAGAVLLTGVAACGDDSDDGSSADSPSASEASDASASPSASGSEDSESEAFADKSVEEIQAAAVKDMRALQFVRVAGTLRDDASELAVDLRLSAQGDCDGKVSVDGADAEIIGVGNTSYLKGTEEFWRKSAGDDAGQQADALISALAGKWAKIPGGDFNEFCDLNSFLDDLDDPDDASESADPQTEVVGETSVADTPAVEVKIYDDAEVSTVWVGTEEGRHYILKMRVEDGENPGEFTFSEFNDAFKVKAPPKNQVVDLGSADDEPDD